MELYVSNLSYDVTDEELGRAFSPFGDVRHATVIKDKVTGRSRGFGFVDMPDAGAAKAAIEALTGRPLRGRPMAVREARPRGEMPPPSARPAMRPVAGAPFAGPRPPPLAPDRARPPMPGHDRPAGSVPTVPRRPGGQEDAEEEGGGEARPGRAEDSAERPERTRRHQYKHDAVRHRRPEVRFEDGLARKQALKRDTERRGKWGEEDEDDALGHRVR